MYSRALKSQHFQFLNPIIVLHHGNQQLTTDNSGTIYDARLEEYF